jgi:hypothetical protein
MTEKTNCPSESAIASPARGWRAAFPPAQWLATYQPQWLAKDAIAGVTLAAYAGCWKLKSASSPGRGEDLRSGPASSFRIWVYPRLGGTLRLPRRIKLDTFARS